MTLSKTSGYIIRACEFYMQSIQIFKHVYSEDEKEGKQTSNNHILHGTRIN
jgi:hypothetical protein